MNTAATQTQTGPSSRALIIVLWILLAIAGVEFFMRAPVRYLRPTYWNDLSQNYAASRLWLRGKNFSDPDVFVALWRDELSSPLDVSVRTRLAPMPGNLILLAPIALLPFPTAFNVWLGVLLVAFAVTVWALLRAAGLRFPDPPAIAFTAFCLAFAPFHTGIATGNQTIVVLAFCALGILFATRDHDAAAGIWFGLACSLKPHLGSLLVLYYLIRFRWRLFMTAVATTTAITLIAIAWLEICGVSWVHDYFRNLRGFASHNRIDDFTNSNPIRFLLINLQVPFYSFTGDAHSANLLAFSVGFLLIAAWIYLCFRNRPDRDKQADALLSLGAISVISLLPLYHRLYDATLLAIPLAWCLSRKPSIFKNLANYALILMLPFLVPGSALLVDLAQRGIIPMSWIHSRFGECFLLPHITWFMLALAILLLTAMAREKAYGNGTQEGTSA